jgi:transposase
VVDLEHQRLTPSRAIWLVLRRPERRGEEDERRLAALQDAHPDLGAAVELAQDFTRMVRDRQPQRLDAWLTRAAQSALAPFRSFATRLRRDQAAVHAALRCLGAPARSKGTSTV